MAFHTPIGVWIWQAEMITSKRTVGFFHSQGANPRNRGNSNSVTTRKMAPNSNVERFVYRLNNRLQFLKLNNKIDKYLLFTFTN